MGLFKSFLRDTDIDMAEDMAYLPNQEEQNQNKEVQGHPITTRLIIYFQY